METANSVVSNKNNVILEKSKSLFLKHGFKKITVEEICKEAGVSKMTFYRMFENKEKVAEKILVEMINGNTLKYREIMNSDSSFQLKIQQIIRLRETVSYQLGENFIKDLMSLPDSPLKTIFEEQQKKGYKELARDLIKAQKAGLIRNDIKPEFILFMLDDMNSKLKDKKFTRLYNNIQDAIMDLTNFFFYGIMTNRVH